MKCQDRCNQGRDLCPTPVECNLFGEEPDEPLIGFLLVCAVVGISLGAVVWVAIFGW